MEIQAADFDRFLYLISELGDRDVPFYPVGGNRVRVDDKYYATVLELPAQSWQLIVDAPAQPEEAVPGEPSEPAQEHEEPDDSGESPEEPPARPPLGGPGSGRDAWAEYAETVFGLEITEDMSRDDIVDAVEAMED